VIGYLDIIELHYRIRMEANPVFIIYIISNKPVSEWQITRQAYVVAMKAVKKRN